MGIHRRSIDWFAALVFASLLALAVGIARAASPAVIAVQPPGAGQTTTWIRGTAGADQDADRVQCTMTVNRNGGTSNMHLACTIGPVGNARNCTPSGDTSSLLAGTVIGCGGPNNRVTIMLVRGMPTPDRWEMAANDQFKTGAF